MQPLAYARGNKVHGWMWSWAKTELSKCFHTEGRDSQTFWSLMTPEHWQPSLRFPSRKLEDEEQPPRTTAQPGSNSKARWHQLQPHARHPESISHNRWGRAPAPRQVEVRCHNAGDKNLRSCQKWKTNVTYKRMALDNRYAKKAIPSCFWRKIISNRHLYT